RPDERPQPPPPAGYALRSPLASRLALCRGVSFRGPGGGAGPSLSVHVMWTTKGAGQRCRINRNPHKLTEQAGRTARTQKPDPLAVMINDSCRAENAAPRIRA